MEEKIKAPKNITPLISNVFALIDIILLIVVAYAVYKYNQVNGISYAEIGRITGPIYFVGEIPWITFALVILIILYIFSKKNKVYDFKKIFRSKTFWGFLILTAFLILPIIHLEY